MSDLQTWNSKRKLYNQVQQTNELDCSLLILTTAINYRCRMTDNGCRLRVYGLLALVKYESIAAHDTRAIMASFVLRKRTLWLSERDHIPRKKTYTKKENFVACTEKDKIVTYSENITLWLVLRKRTLWHTFEERHIVTERQTECVLLSESEDCDLPLTRSEQTHYN